MESQFHGDVTNFDQCPVPDNQRKRTDVFCTICTGLFALILFIIACATFNNYNLVKMTYYTDGEGNTCAFDLPDFPMVYFTSLTDPSKRLCVSSCPKAGDTSLHCHPTANLACAKNSNPNFEVTIYDSEQVINRIGYICMPTDSDTYNQISNISDLTGKYTFLTIYDSIWTSLWISIVFGIVLIAAIQFLSRKVVHWIFILGSLTFIALGIVIFIVPAGFVLFKIVGGALFIFMGLITAASYIKPQYRVQIFICGRLFEIAAAIVKQRPLILIYIFLWWVFQVGLIALTAFQILSAWSIGPLYFDPKYPFWYVGSFISNLLSFFFFVQFIWGLSFLKEAFNFCVGGFATQWYCFKTNDTSKIGLFHSFKLLLKYHWGSVAGGSLLLWLFYFIDLFIDFFFSTDNHYNKNSKPAHMFTRKTVQRRGVRSFFGLIRSEAFAYINLIPIPYCNASRYCEMLASDSNFYDRSQTTNRLYRLSAHIIIMMIATLIALAANTHTNNSPNIIGVIFVAIVSLFSVTYFISLHGDLAEGILVSIFVEERLNGMCMGCNDYGQVQGNVALTRPVDMVKNLHNDDLNEIYNQATLAEYAMGRLNNEEQRSSSANQPRF